MESALARLRAIPTDMDYKGQRLAEQIFQTVTGVFAIAGFVWGYMVEEFGQTVYVVLAGFFLSCVLTLPPWPFYRRSPLPWQPPRDPGEPPRAPDPGRKSKKNKPLAQREGR
ncbi:signal peptidase complex subunit 1 [Petromyzon marinus]|uniref:Signal peptidase complex subunit 1 n=1 Tax=Petromyzon marinus TaxID=7757 RepID=A0AAJ7XAR4_PETMA|nr:signal peptidase complex subunit 1 [Petromyzon marinus]